MRKAFARCTFSLVAIGLLLLFAGPACAAAGSGGTAVPILVYHRFGPIAADEMTVTTPVFEKQLEWLRLHQIQIVPLRTVVDAVRGTKPADIGHAIVITVDDGHRSVYTDLYPLIQRYHFPVTLFIYPSAISNASYALTWAQLEEMARSGLVDVQSHTFWHPNFNHEKKKLGPEKYQAFVHMQFLRPKEILGKHVSGTIDMLAWPFGIHDEKLEGMAAKDGYVAAFTLDRRPATPGMNPLALPRYLMTDYDRGARFGAIASGIAR